MVSAAKADDERVQYRIVARVGPPEIAETASFYQRLSRSKDKRRRLTVQDVRETFLLSAMTVAARAMSPRWLIRLCDLSSRVRRRRHIRKSFPVFQRSLRSVLGITQDDQARAVFERWRTQLHRRRMVLARELVGGVRPEIAIVGRENLDAALTGGRGAILWTAELVHGTIIGKRGLSDAGYAIHQVAAERHGLTHSLYAQATFNRLLQSVENRYLQSRIAFDRAELTSVTRRALRVLQRGEPVIYTSNTFAGSAFVEVAFGAAGHLSMATGVISIALRHDVPLLCMRVIETEPLGRYEIQITENLAREFQGRRRTARERDYAAMAQIALKARDFLLQSIERAPEQLLFWEGMDRSRLEARSSTCERRF